MMFRHCSLVIGHRSLVLFGLWLGVLGIWAQEQPSGQTKERRREVLINADRIDASTAGEGVWILEGNVEMKHEDTSMYAQHIVWNRGNRSARLTQNVHVVNPDSVLTGDVCDVDMKGKIATLTGNVKVITLRKRKGGDKAYEDDWDKYEHMRWTTTCLKLVYNYGNDTGEATGNIVSRSDDGEYTFYSDIAQYRLLGNDDEVLTLPQNPRMETKDGETFTCSTATVIFHPDDTQNVTATGVRARTYAESGGEEQGGGGGQQPSAAPAQGGGGGGEQPAATPAQPPAEGEAAPPSQ